MTSPALGIGYSLWLKTRWMTAMALATLLVFAVASLTMTWAHEFILPAYLMVMVFELAVVSNAFVFISPTWVMTSAVLLAVPLASIIAAPLALFANRHC